MSARPFHYPPDVEPIRRFDGQSYSAALESWAWMDGLAGLSPAFTNAFGDLFLQAEDGSFSFLSILDGTLRRVWPDGAALQAAVNTPQTQDEYLIIGLVQDASGAGLDPGPTQILSFTVPPVLGGDVAVENVAVADFVVTVDLAGQMHQQIKDLPPGHHLWSVHRLTPDLAVVSRQAPGRLPQPSSLRMWLPAAGCPSAQRR